MSTVSQPVLKIAVCDFQVNSEIAVSGPKQDEIHIWRKPLEPESGEVDRLRRLLSPDELERAARFRFESSRIEYIVSRGTLRTLLGSYVGVSPRKLTFVYSEYGQPSLALSESYDQLNFNVAHSGKMALFALAKGRRIGIDVEQLRTDFSVAEIAERFFSVAERTTLRELPREQQPAAFFRCWTRKEAFIKALGEGLSHPLDHFDVSLAADQPAALLATRPDPNEARSWMLCDIQVPTSYAAALAAETKCRRI